MPKTITRILANDLGTEEVYSSDVFDKRFNVKIAEVVFYKGFKICAPHPLGSKKDGLKNAFLISRDGKRIDTALSKRQAKIRIDEMTSK